MRWFESFWDIPSGSINASPLFKEKLMKNEFVLQFKKLKKN